MTAKVPNNEMQFRSKLYSLWDIKHVYMSPSCKNNRMCSVEMLHKYRAYKEQWNKNNRMYSVEICTLHKYRAYKEQWNFYANLTLDFENVEKRNTNFHLLRTFTF